MMMLCLWKLQLFVVLSSVICSALRLDDGDDKVATLDQGRPGGGIRTVPSDSWSKEPLQSMTFGGLDIHQSLGHGPNAPKASIDKKRIVRDIKKALIASGFEEPEPDADDVKDPELQPLYDELLAQKSNKTLLDARLHHLDGRSHLDSEGFKGSSALLFQEFEKRMTNRSFMFLELGSGVGSFSRLLLRKFPGAVGIGISPNAGLSSLSNAVLSKYVKDNRFYSINARMEEMTSVAGIESAFGEVDYVFMPGALCMTSGLGDVHKVLKQVMYLLKPGGHATGKTMPDAAAGQGACRTVIPAAFWHVEAACGCYDLVDTVHMWEMVHSDSPDLQECRYWVHVQKPLNDHSRSSKTCATCHAKDQMAGAGKLLFTSVDQCRIDFFLHHHRIALFTFVTFVAMISVAACICRRRGVAGKGEAAVGRWHESGAIADSNKKFATDVDASGDGKVLTFKSIGNRGGATLVAVETYPNMIEVSNFRTEPVAFKVKTTSPQAYIVGPVGGVLGPKGSKKVAIHWSPEWTKMQSKVKNNRFLIQAISVTSGEYPTKEEWSKFRREDVQEQELRCFSHGEDAPSTLAKFAPLKVDPAAVASKFPVGHDLTSEAEHEMYLRAAQEFHEGLTLKELQEVETAISSTTKETTNHPVLLHLAVKTAISKKLMAGLPAFHCTVVFALYREVNKMVPKGQDLPGTSHPDGEDFVRRKHKQMSWLFDKRKDCSWTMIGIDDGCDHDSGGLMEEIVRNEGYTNVSVHRLAKAVKEGSCPVLDIRKLKEGWVDDDWNREVRASQRGGAILLGLHLAGKETDACSRSGKRHIIVHTDADLSSDLSTCGLNFKAIVDGADVSVSQRFGQPNAVNCSRKLKGCGVVPGLARKSIVHLSLRHKLRTKLLPPLAPLVDTSCRHRAITGELSAAILGKVRDYGGSFDLDWLICAAIGSKANKSENASLRPTAIAWVAGVAESADSAFRCGDDEDYSEPSSRNTPPETEASTAVWLQGFQTVCQIHERHEEDLKKMIPAMKVKAEPYLKWARKMDAKAYTTLVNKLLTKLSDQELSVVPLPFIMDMSVAKLEHMSSNAEESKR